jgi:membrane protein
MVLHGYDVVALAKKTWAEIGKDKISVYAAQMAYSSFFALFPLLLFFAALLSLIADKQTVMGEFNARLASALPADVASLLDKTLATVVFAKGAPGLLSFGLITAAWSGSSIFGALRAALNAAYDVDERRPLWKQYGLQLGMLVLAGIVLLSATVVLLNGEGVVNWLGSRLGLSAITRTVWTVLQFPLAIAALVAVLWLLYYFLPDCRHQDKKTLMVGATLSTLLWIAATLLFRLYVQKFNALNPAYGAIGAIMVLLTWMYYSSFVLLAVGELMSELDQGTGRVDGRRTEAPLSGAAVPRSRALVLRPESDGGVAASNRPGIRWAVFERLAPVRAVRRARGLVASTQRWLDGALEHLRFDAAAAINEVRAAARAVGVGSVLCGVAATLGLLGGLSLLAGIILLIGDQWLPADWYPAAALIVAAIAALATWRLTRRGVSILSSAFQHGDVTRRESGATQRHRPATRTRAAAV